MDRAEIQSCPPSLSPRVSHSRRGRKRVPGPEEGSLKHKQALSEKHPAVHIDTITPRRGSRSERDKSLKAEPVWDPHTHPGSWRAVWVYSKKRAARDNQTLTAQANRARAVIAGEKRPKGTRFVTVHQGDQVLDEASIARARSLVGLKGYVTNIPARLMDAGEVVSSYHELWHVE